MANYHHKRKMNDKTITILGMALVALVVVGIAFVAVSNNMPAKAVQPSATQSVQAREPDLTPTHYVQFDIQDYGTITAELYGKEAPITVDNFVQLVENGFYDGLTFHRIIKGFMIQGGDPMGNGTGGSAVNIKGEFASNGVQNDIKHTRGVLSMARSGMPDSASSQFFIMHEAAPHLDGSYAAFGKVLTGMEVVDAICEKTPVTDGNGTVAAGSKPIITSVKLIDAPAVQ